MAKSILFNGYQYSSIPHPFGMPLAFLFFQQTKKGELKMETRHLIERLSGLVVGAAFIMVGIFMVVLGLTWLPVIGILFAIPIMSLSLRFLFPIVEVHTAKDDGLHADFGKQANWCPWPPGDYHKQVA
jgi:hypothetical protein